MTQWILDSIEPKRDMVKVKNVRTQLVRTFFVAFLKDAQVENNVIIAVAEKCGWTIDINTGNRKRFIPNKDITTSQKIESDNLPEFLKKS